MERQLTITRKLTGILAILWIGLLLFASHQYMNAGNNLDDSEESKTNNQVTKVANSTTNITQIVTASICNDSYFASNAANSVVGNTNIQNQEKEESSMSITSTTTIKKMVDYRNFYREYLMDMPGGLKTCDYWFIKENGIYHAFYLEILENCENNNDQTIGHMTSTDFLNWEYQGTVLRGYRSGTWTNKQLATGSVVKYKNRYYMMFTGHSSTVTGLGMAVSDDLYTWEMVGTHPVISGNVLYQSSYEGVNHACHVLADPYIYPEAIDGYYYAYVNSWAADQPKNSRGCQVMFRSADMLHWEPYKIAILTDDLDRLETCQVWKYRNKWYMSFGGRRVNPDGGDFDDVESANYIYMADRFDGPYLKQPWSKIGYETDQYYYIQKQITDPYGDDVMLVMAPYKGVLWPYKIHYGIDGKITFTVSKK